MRKWLFVLFLLPVFSGFSIVAIASPPKPPTDIALGDYSRVNTYINKLIRHWMEEDDVAGLSIVVVNDNKIIFEKGFGYSNIEREQLATPDTVYRVGAISGVFTASLILKLTELGEIQLDDNIEKYLPELGFQYYDNQKYTITIQNLLTHHAGLPISRFEGSWREQETDLQPLLAQLNDSYASYPPNTIYAYSNIGYSLLALIVERVTRMSFVEAMRQYVLQPLAMHNTDIRYSKKIQSKLATAYKKDETHKLLFPRDIASLGIYSNAKDMSKLLRMMLESGDKTVISKASVESMMHAHNANVALDLEKRIGLGVNIDGMKVVNGGPVVWRSGATLGFRARMALLPRHDIAVIALSNDAKSWDAIADITERTLQVMLQAKTGINQDLKDNNKNLRLPKTDAHKLSDYYSSFLGYIPIRRDNGTITASLLDWPLNLKPAGQGWYTLEYDLFGFIPIDITWIADLKVRPSLVENKNILIALYKGKQYLVGSHFSFKKPNSIWAKRQGEYRIINHDALLESMEINSGRLSIEEDKLFFIYELPDWYGLELHLPMQVLSDDLAIVPGLGTALNETVQVKRFGSKEYLEYSGYLLEKIKPTESVFDFF